MYLKSNKSITILWKTYNHDKKDKLLFLQFVLIKLGIKNIINLHQKLIVQEIN